MKLFVSIIFSFFLFTLASAQDECQTAVDWDGLSSNCLDINLDENSSNTLNGLCVNDTSQNNYWLSFVADGPEISMYAIHDEGKDVYITLIRFTAQDCDPIKYTELGCETNQFYANDLLTVGEKYHVIVNVENNEGGNLEFCVNNPDITPPPGNNEPCNAYIIQPDSTCLVGTTVNADPFVNDELCGQDFINSVWYKFTLSEGLIFGAEFYIDNVSLEGDIRVTLVSFGNNDCAGEGFGKQQYCGPADGFAFDYVNLNAGESCYVEVATNELAAGEFELCVKELEALPNTTPCGAVTVVPNDACLSFDTYYSIFEYDLPNCDFTNQKIYYQFYTGDDLDGVSLELEKSDDQQDVFLGLGYYQGNWCENNFFWVDSYCGDVSEASFSADGLMRNQVYHIVVGTNFGFTGEFDLCIDGEYDSPYTNGHPCTAYNIDNFTGCTGGSNAYGSLDLVDTICYDVAPVIKNWYKVNLERYDYAIDVEFLELSNLPLHKVELGYFENGCLDSFRVMSDFCTVLETSTTSFTFPDSIDYAYISVATPSDQVYNYSICVNPIDIGEQCFENDFCTEAEPIGIVNVDENLCFTACSFGSTIEDTQEFFTSTYATTWYTFETDVDITEIEVQALNGTTPGFFLGLVESGSCVNVDFDDSRYIQLTDFEAFRIHVKPETSYLLAFASADEQGGTLDLCFEAKEANLCATNDRLEVISASLGSPLEGPFQEDEIVSFCYQIDEFDNVSESSCQWLQGIIPSFGNGWNDLSFDSVGMPLGASSINSVSPDVTWAWRNDSHSHITNTYRRIGASSLGLPELCHVYQDNCDGEMLQQGDLLPPGWYAWNFSQGLMHPDSTYGDGVSCETNNGPWTVCFDLQVGPISTDSDLSVSFHTLSDGEIGYVGVSDSSCMEDMPLSEKFHIDCLDNPIDSLMTVLTCSENVTLASLPEDQYFFWIHINNEKVEGAVNGSSDRFSVALVNETDEIQTVRYFLKAYSQSGCHEVNYEIDVKVYPALNINREENTVICQNDSVSMIDVIDLSSQIIGDFYVDWEDESMVDEADAFFSGNSDQNFAYHIISEAGCTFTDTVFLEVEDLIVTDHIVPFTICKNDEISMNEMIDLDHLIADSFSVDWHYGALEDITTADTSFTQTTSIPFTLTGEAGCVYEGTQEIIVPFVDINILGKDKYCSADTISISAGYIFDQQHERFWIFPTGDTLYLSGISRPANIFDPGENEFEFQLYTEEGCPFYAFDTITIYESPELQFNQVDSELGICSYDSLFLNVDIKPDFYQASWETPIGSSNENNLIIKEPGSYSVVTGYEDSFISCLDSAKFILEIFPDVITDMVYDPLICEGDSTLVESTVPNYKFVWSNGEFSSAQLLPAGDYAVTVSNDPGCVAIFEIEIEEQAIPSPDFTYVAELCEGDSTWIESSDINLDYQWSTNSDSSAILSFGGEYTVTVTDDEMCLDSFDFVVTATEYPVVDFSYEIIEDSLFLYNLSENAMDCQWMVNDDLIGGNVDTVLVLAEGDYVLSLSCYNGECGDFLSEDITIMLVGLEAQKGFNWTIFPNPNAGYFSLAFSEKQLLGSIEIIDLQGRVVYTQKEPPLADRYDLNVDLNSGVYLVQVVRDGAVFSKRIVVQK